LIAAVTSRGRATEHDPDAGSPSVGTLFRIAMTAARLRDRVVRRAERRLGSPAERRPPGVPLHPKGV
jgi:hypothetical protein